MKSTRTPLGLIQHAIAAMGISLLAILIGFLPIPDGYRLVVILLAASAGFALSWRYKRQLEAGVRAESWTETDLDSASVWIEARRWTWIPIIGYLAFMVMWYVLSFRADFRTLGWVVGYPSTWIIRSLRISVLPDDPHPKLYPSEAVPLRTRVTLEKALRALPSTGFAPPPRPPWKFELDQYPKKRS